MFTSKRVFLNLTAIVAILCMTLLFIKMASAEEMGEFPADDSAAAPFGADPDEGSGDFYNDDQMDMDAPPEIDEDMSYRYSNEMIQNPMDAMADSSSFDGANYDSFRSARVSGSDYYEFPSQNDIDGPSHFSDDDYEDFTY